MTPNSLKILFLGLILFFVGCDGNPPNYDDSDSKHTKSPVAPLDEDTDQNPDTDTPSDTDLSIDTITEIPDIPIGEWEWIPVEGTYCRDGSEAGISVRTGSKSDHLLIFLEGSGICFNLATCLTNAQKIVKFGQNPSYMPFGIFNFSKENNPFKDWNIVYIPYCTGDCHMGSNPDGHIPNLGKQMFVGGDNYRTFLKSIVAKFKESAVVLLAGFSGGAIGAAGNAYATVKAFGDDVTFAGISDGATIISDEYMTPCLQKLLAHTWNVEKYIPKNCEDCFPTQGGSLFNLYTYMANQYPNKPSGLISALNDPMMTTFLSFGWNECSGHALYPMDKYQEGLENLRDYVTGIGMKGGTYYYDGILHGTLKYENFYTMNIGGESLIDWVNTIIEGKTTIHVAP